MAAANVRALPARVVFYLLLLPGLLVFGVRALFAWPGTPFGSEAFLWTHDPDPWMRLNLVRDLLEHGRWYDHTLARSNAPMGGSLNGWTRPLDIVIAVLAQTMTGDLTLRLIKAALLLPMIWATLFMAGLLRAVQTLYPQPKPDAMLLAAFFVATLPLTWNYFDVANADHHAPLAALFVWVVSFAVAERLTRRAAAIIGMLLGLMLWISPEALLIIAAVSGMWIVEWIFKGRSAVASMVATLALAGTAAVAVMIERPIDAWMVPIYDGISCVQVTLCVLMSGAWMVLAALPLARRASWRQRLAAVIAVAVVALGGMAQMYPLFFVHPVTMLHPIIREAFLSRLAELQPLWRQENGFAQCAILWQPVAALLAAWSMLRSARGGTPNVRVRMRIVLLFVACLAFCLSCVRWFYYMAPLAALVLTVVVMPLFAQADASRMHIVRRMALLLLITLPPIVLVRLPLFFAAAAQSTPAVAAASFVGNDLQANAACERAVSRHIRSGALVRALGGAPEIVFVSTNIAIEMLYFTPYRVIASNDQHDGASMAYLWDALRVENTDDLRRYLSQRQGSALLLCPDPSSTKGSVLRRLYDGTLNPPSWLIPVAVQQDASDYAAPQPKLMRVLAP